MFIDKVSITVESGKGGDGAVSFRREKYVAAGGPDGGDGGRGGNIVFVASKNMNTLINYRYKRKYVAESGMAGGGRKQSGKNGKDLFLEVPIGTIVKDAETGRIIADMSEDEQVVAARGGNGGWGNCHFSTPTRQIPRFSKPGLPGRKMTINLELKLLADVGLVGFPNVGKSSLISVLSNAKPEIANYHFTTLVPVLGVVKIDDSRSYVMADIPGLIEGASDGVGLGHDFLRHVERCRLIVHVVDISGSEFRDPIDDFEKINYELANFDMELAKRPQVVCGNKSDMATEEQIDAFEKYVTDKGYKFFLISAATHSGLKELKQHLAQRLTELPPVIRYEAEPEMIEIESGNKYEFSIEKKDDVYIVEAPWLINVLGSCNMEDYESLQYFQRVLVRTGIIDKLVEMGIEENDLVSIYDFEFNYIE